PIMSNFADGGPTDPPPYRAKNKADYDYRVQMYNDSAALYSNYQNLLKSLLREGYEEEAEEGVSWEVYKQDAREDSEITGLSARGTLFSVDDFIPGTINRRLVPQLFSDRIDPAGVSVFSNRVSG